MISSTEIHKYLCLDYFAQHCGEISNLFAISAEKGYCSEVFCRQFMTSDYAMNLDLVPVNEELPSAAVMIQEYQKKFNPVSCDDFIDTEVMRWIGHIYCYWHLTKNESSKEIYQQADYNKMINVYEGMHCITEDLVIDSLKTNK